jgi:class 3 adenylate cyclase
VVSVLLEHRLASSVEPLPLTVLVGFFGMNLGAVSAIMFFVVRYFVQENAKAQDRSERLLLNILPRPIAERLKHHPTTIADAHAEVTVLFADIVEFTKFSASILPQRLVEILNDVFSEFDRLAERHGLEKIKTVGDAYMVVGGLPTPRADHAEAVAEMALEMRDALAGYEKTIGASLQLRIGIHTGPVVAGVIGRRKFSYDLWGDTVNTASRMESHGLPGVIQVT